MIINKNIFFFVSIIFLYKNIFTCGFFGYQEPKKAIVIGATSGMGRQVAKLIAADGYIVGLVGRRLNLLESLQKEIPTKTLIRQIDVTSEDSSEKLKNLIKDLGGLDLILVSISAANDYNPDSDKERENNIKTLETDLLGFWKMADTALEYFEIHGAGHLVGISSTSGLVGEAGNPVYSGAKAFIQRYLEGVRNRIAQKSRALGIEIPIYVTDIIPGWVEVEAVDVHKIPQAYWIATTEKAAKQIYSAIKKKKKRAYITKRWALISLLYKITPDFVYNYLGGF